MKMYNAKGVCCDVDKGQRQTMLDAGWTREKPAVKPETVDELTDEQKAAEEAEAKAAAEKAAAEKKANKK